MTYRAKMQGGEVVFESGQKPPDGTELRVEEVSLAATDAEKSGETAGQFLLRFSGIVTGDDFPTDGSEQVDHYVYGTPKR